MPDPAPTKTVPINILVNKIRSSLQQIPQFTALTEEAIDLCSALQNALTYLAVFNKKSFRAETGQIEKPKLLGFAQALRAAMPSSLPPEKLDFLAGLVKKRFSGTDVRVLDIVKTEDMAKEFDAKFGQYPGKGDIKLGKALVDLSFLATMFQMFADQKISISGELKRG